MRIIRESLFRAEICLSLKENTTQFLRIGALRLAVPLTEMAVFFCVMVILQADFGEKYAASFARYLYGDLLTRFVENVTELAAIAALVMLALNLLMRYVAEVMSSELRNRIEIHDIRYLIESYLWSDVRSAKEVGRAKVAECIQRDAAARATAIWAFNDFSAGVLAAIVYFAGVVVLDWRVLLLALVIYVVPMMLTRDRYQKILNGSKDQLQKYEEWQVFTMDLLHAHDRIKLDALENDLDAKAAIVVPDCYKWRRFKQALQSNYRVWMDGLPIFALIAVTYISSVYLGVSATILMILVVVIGRMRSTVEQANAALFKLIEIVPSLDRYKLICDGLKSHRAVQLEHHSGKVRLTRVTSENVRFAYPDGSEVLSGINLTLRAGDRVLIQGGSGQGKSTLLEILAGLLAPSQGVVAFDGKPLTDELFYEYRNSISYVSPEIHLFTGSLRDNLRLGNTATDEEIMEALKIAGLAPLLSTWSDGLDTHIGNNGDRLSLGQRQRVLLARLFMKRPWFILLDEATANLDPRLEIEMMESLTKHLDPECIVVVVAHKAPQGMAFNHCWRLELGSLSASEPSYSTTT